MQSSTIGGPSRGASKSYLRGGVARASGSARFSRPGKTGNSSRTVPRSRRACRSSSRPVTHPAIPPAVLPRPALAVDNMASSDAVDLTSVRAKIKAKDYGAALHELRDLAEDTQQADVYNLLGFALRKTGDYATSLTYYTKALELAPDHKAAHEYLGELFVQTGKLAQAKEQLAVLVRL